MTLSKIAKSKQYIQFDELITSSQSHFVLTMVYGSNDIGSRCQLWEDLLRGKTTLPWIVTGDFNCICSSSEKQGSPSLNHSAMDDFNDFINDASLLEMTTTGLDFTLCNMNQSRPIKCHLDRTLISTSYLSLFPNYATHV